MVWLEQVGHPCWGRPVNSNFPQACFRLGVVFTKSSWPLVGGMVLWSWTIEFEISSGHSGCRFMEECRLII